VKECLTFGSDPRHLASVRAAVRRFLSACGYDEMKIELLVLAVDEACTNVIRHAYANCPNNRVHLELQKLRKEIKITLRDFGKPCDPARIRSRKLEDIRPGGVGVHIISQAFDQVCYAPFARGTRLTLRKRLPEGL